MAVLTIEGYRPSELLALTQEEISQLILCDRPVVFQAGSATVLGQFAVREDWLGVELSHIDGGGEGVLRALWGLAEQIAGRFALAGVVWTVHAAECANPNPRLRRLLERMGFELVAVGTGRPAYVLSREISKNREGN